MAVGLMAVGLVVGCAHRRGEMRLPSTPVGLSLPEASGATVRTQDARRLGRRPSKGAESQVTRPGGEEGAIVWSGRGRGAVEELRNVDSVRPLPEPPVLPVEVAAPGPSLGESRVGPGPIEVGAGGSLPAGLVSDRTEPKLDSQLASNGDPGTEAGGRVSEIRALIQQAQARLAEIRTYQARVVRQERVGETLQPEEELILSVRREPFAVRLEWPAGTANEGREVLYSVVETDGKMQIRQPGSLVPRVALAVDSPLVRANSRHPITEAGFDELLRNLERTVRGVETGQGRSRLSWEGPVKVAEVGRDCHRITEVREDGETWVVGLDAETLLPIYVCGTDGRGQLLERYRFLDVRTEVAELSQPGAFDPDARWGSGGLLGRLARGLETGGEAERTAR